MGYKLPKKAKHKWLRALRSGKFLQGQGELRAKRIVYDEETGMATDKKETRFCCLGVACNIGLTRRASNGDEFCRKTFLPMKIQERLANMNDNGTSFQKIASWISKNL